MLFCVFVVSPFTPQPFVLHFRSEPIGPPSPRGASRLCTHLTPQDIGIVFFHFPTPPHASFQFILHCIPRRTLTQSVSFPETSVLRTGDPLLAFCHESSLSSSCSLFPPVTIFLGCFESLTVLLMLISFERDERELLSFSHRPGTAYFLKFLRICHCSPP